MRQEGNTVAKLCEGQPERIPGWMREHMAAEQFLKRYRAQGK